MEMKKPNVNSNTLMSVAKGLIAGVAGVWALDRVTWFMWNREDPEALEREKLARPGGMDPAHVIAHKIAHGLGTELTPAQPHPAGIAVHYMLGVVPGAIYGAMRKEQSKPQIGRGLGIGLGLFLLQDELGNSLLGTSGSPRQYPWQAHARGLVGHLVYGAALEGALALLDRVKPSAKREQIPAEEPRQEIEQRPHRPESSTTIRGM